MTTIKAKAYIPSAGEYDAFKEKFPAFAGAVVSEIAKRQGAGINEDYNGNGYYPLRTRCEDDWHFYYVSSGGNCNAGHYKRDGFGLAGLRVVLSLIYNPKSSIVRHCRNVFRAAKNYDRTAQRDLTKKSMAPVVFYAGNDYIWTNKEDCEEGKSKVMNLISLELPECVVFFKNPQDPNDYAKAAEKLHAQCERVAFENATEEEKAMAVEVEMSNEDDYEKVKYVIADNKAENFLYEAIDNLYSCFARREISIKDLQQGLTKIVDDMEVQTAYSDEDIDKVANYISQKYAEYKEPNQRRRKKKNAIKAISNVIKSLEEEDEIENC